MKRLCVARKMRRGRGKYVSLRRDKKKKDVRNRWLGSTLKLTVTRTDRHASVSRKYRSVSPHCNSAPIKLNQVVRVIRRWFRPIGLTLQSSIILTLVFLRMISSTWFSNRISGFLLQLESELPRFYRARRPTCASSSRFATK